MLEAILALILAMLLLMVIKVVAFERAARRSIDK
jgi:hypothetical protein